MKTISLVTQKGGPGKSTVAVSLAAYVAGEGKSVLLIDLDPQQSATSWYTKRPDHLAKNLDLICDLDPSHLPDVIEQARQEGVDLVLIDTAGRDAVGVVHPLGVSDFVLVPSRPTTDDMEGSMQTVSKLKELEIPFAYVMTQTPPTLMGFRPASRTREAMNALSSFADVCPVCIVLRTIYQDSKNEGLGVSEAEPEGKAAREIAKLWDWVDETAKERISVEL